MGKKHYRSSERPLSPARNSENIRSVAKTGQITAKKQNELETPKNDRFLIKKPNDSWDY